MIRQLEYPYFLVNYAWHPLEDQLEEPELLHPQRVQLDFVEELPVEAVPLVAQAVARARPVAEALQLRVVCVVGFCTSIS
jgi:hypothetical protein